MERREKPCACLYLSKGPAPLFNQKSNSLPSRGHLTGRPAACAPSTQRDAGSTTLPACLSVFFVTVDLIYYLPARGGGAEGAIASSPRCVTRRIVYPVVPRCKMQVSLKRGTRRVAHGGSSGQGRQTERYLSRLQAHSVTRRLLAFSPNTTPIQVAIQPGLFNAPSVLNGRL